MGHGRRYPGGAKSSTSLPPRSSKKKDVPRIQLWGNWARIGTIDRLRRPRSVSGAFRHHERRGELDAHACQPPRWSEDDRSYFSLMAAFTLAAISGGIAVILCAVLACSAPLAITSASSFPSMTALQPGIKSPHLSTFAMIALPPVLLRPD